MLTQLFQKLITLPAIISSLFFPVVQIQGPIVIERLPSLGADNFTPAQAQKFTLSGSGVSASATSVILQTMHTPDGRDILMSMLGNLACGTFEPGTAREEQISFTGITQNSDDTATLTGASRGLDFITPYAPSSTLQKAHAGGSIFVLSNNPACVSQFASVKNDETITAQWQFPTSTTQAPKYTTSTTYTLNGSYPTSTLADIDYVNRIATSGAPDASTGVKGLVELATTAQTASGTPAGDDTTALIVPRASDFGATSTARQMVPVTEADGDLNAAFIGQDQDYTWTGSQTFNGTSTVAGTSTISGELRISSASTTVGTANSTTTYTGRQVGQFGRILHATNTDVDTRNTTGNQTVLSFTVESSTLSTNNAIEVFIPIDVFGCADSASTTVRFQYGATNIATSTMNCPSASSPNNYQGSIKVNLFGNSGTASQFGWLGLEIIGQTSASQTGTFPWTVYSEGTSAVDSTASQTFSVIAFNSTASTNFGFLTMGGYAKLIPSN